MRRITEIIIHCTATSEGRDFTVEDIRRVHKKRGFNDVGYHYIVYRDGSIHKGRAEEFIGAHCKGHNSYSIGVCYVGGMTADNRSPKDTRTPEQKAALVALIKRLKASYPKATIHGHREFANKACPCFNAREEYQNL